MRHFLALIALAIGVSSAQAATLSSDFPVAETTAIQGAPSVAYDPNHDRFLAVWFDQRNRPTSRMDVYGRLLDGHGQPVGPDFPITRARGSQGFPSVAFDPVNDRFLVVWIDWRDARDVDSDIWGRFVNADGTPHGEEFPISAQRRVSQKFVNLAFDPVRQRYLVLWSDSRNNRIDKLYGRYVGAGGALEGDEFYVTLEGTHQDSPSLLYDQARDRYLVTWRDTRQAGPAELEKSIWGIFIDGDGGPAGPSFLIGLEKDGCVPLSRYAVSQVPGEDYYFIAWTSSPRYHEMMPSEGGWPDRQRGHDIYGAFIGAADGSLVKPPFMIASEIDYQKSASVAYDSENERFLVVWYDLRRPPSGRDMDIYGRFVSTRGELSDEFLVSESGTGGLKRYPVISYSPKTGSFLVLWEDGRHYPEVIRQIFGRVW